MNGFVKRGLVLLVIAALALACAGCGAPKDKAYAAKEKFKLNDNTFALEKWMRKPDMDSGSKKAYDLCLLMVGDDVPVIINGANMTSGVNVAFALGEDTVDAGTVGYQHNVDVPGYGVRASFTLLLPEDSELPQSAELYDVSNKEKRVALNLSGLTVEE